VAEDLLGHRRLSDKKTVNQRLAVLEKKKARDKRRTQMRFGFLRALARVIERDFSLHAAADIFKPG
jgi:flagellar motility protein MotE (MotC chaperone)